MTRLIDADLRVYVILDPEHLSPGADLMSVARATLEAGAGVIQLRDKRSTSRELLEEARALAALCREHGALFIVNDRLDIALASGADGAHLGPDDLPIADARRLSAAIAPDFILGGSAGSVEQARALVEAGADYLGVGAVFEARPIKPDASAPRGPAIVRAVTDAVTVPVVGIGGITADNAPEVTAAGAAGVAVIREIVASPDPHAATLRLRAALGHA